MLYAYLATDNPASPSLSAKPVPRTDVKEDVSSCRALQGTRQGYHGLGNRVREILHGDDKFGVLS